MTAPHPARADGTYEGHTGTWRVGAVMDLPDGDGAALVLSWPDFFAEVLSAVEEHGSRVPDALTGPSGPPADRMLRPTRRKVS